MPTGSPWLAGGGTSFPVSGIVFQPPALGPISYIGVPSTAWEIGTPIYDQPFPADPKDYVCRVPYMCKAIERRNNRLALDAPGPYGGYHIGESGFRDHPGGMISFTRTFAIVPDSRNETESYVYPHQILTFSGILAFSPTIIAVSNPSLTELPVTVQSRVQYDYFRTNQPETITLDKAPRAFIVNDVGYMIHGWGALVQGQQILAEDATLRIWMGKIYERRQRFVEFRKLSEEV